VREAMSRLSRAKKREQKRAEGSAASFAAPVDVRVPAVVPEAGQGAGPGVGADAGGASIGGVLVAAAPGEEIQHTVLTHLQRLAAASGHPVLATVHDERIGYVVPLRVDADGSSSLTGEPVRIGTGGAGMPEPGGAEAPGTTAVPPAPTTSGTQPYRDGTEPYRDEPTHVLRPLPGPVPSTSPTYRLRALPEPVQDVVPGTVQPPTGVFGPPPRMDKGPGGTEAPQTEGWAHAVADGAQPPPGPPAPDDDARTGGGEGNPNPAEGRMPHNEPAPAPDLGPDHSLNLSPDPGPDPKPAPPRGFDAVAEAILGDAPPPDSAADASPFAEPATRISEAVQAGQIDAAAHLAEHTAAQASDMLGPDHPEALRLRELAAYIAYLAGDPAHAFGLALDVARAHHRTRDAEAAYGSVQGAVTAWRAVRDPAQGLDLGRDLIALWTELTAEDGPAADDIEQLESARTRMDRLAARAAKSAGPSPS
jgi:hypothetical protein